MISFHNRNNKNYEEHFNKLVKKVFGFDFRHWFDLEVWDETYESYGLWSNECLVAHVAVSKMELLLNDRLCPVNQISAVATDPDYRGRGLQKILFNHIWSKYPETPFLLFANDTVLDFYPRFGFKRARDKTAVADVSINNNHPGQCATPVECRSIVENNVYRSRIFDCANNNCIRLFHLFGEYADKLYRLGNTVIAAEVIGDTLKISDMFSSSHVSWSELIAVLPFKGIKRVEFGFCPDNLGIDYHWEDTSQDNYLFVKNLNGLPDDFAFSEFIRT